MAEFTDDEFFGDPQESGSKGFSDSEFFSTQQPKPQKTEFSDMEFMSTDLKKRNLPSTPEPSSKPTRNKPIKPNFGKDYPTPNGPGNFDEEYPTSLAEDLVKPAMDYYNKRKKQSQGGLSDQDYQALSPLDKIKINNSYNMNELKSGAQVVATAPLHLARSLVQGGVGLAKIGRDKVTQAIAPVDHPITTSQEATNELTQNGVPDWLVKSPELVDKYVANLGMDPGKVDQFMSPDTLTGDVAGLARTGAEVMAPLGVAKNAGLIGKLGLSAYFGGKSAGESYNQNVDQVGIDPAYRTAAAHGVIDATMMQLPMAHALEGTLATGAEKIGLPNILKQIGSKGIPLATEAGAYTGVSRAADQYSHPDQPDWSNEDFLKNLVTFGALRGGGDMVSKGTPDPVARYMKGLPEGELLGGAQIPTGNLMRGGREAMTDAQLDHLRGNLPGQSDIQAHKAVQIHTALAADPAEAPKIQAYLDQMSINHDDAQAGRQPSFPDAEGLIQDLSPQGKRSLETTMRVNQEMYPVIKAQYELKGKDAPEFNPYFNSRRVTDYEGDTYNSGGPAAGSKAKGENSRTVMAWTDNEGNRIPGDLSSKTKGMLGNGAQVERYSGPSGEVWVDQNGNTYNMGHATTQEASSHTGLAYSPDPLANALDASLRFNAAHRNALWQKELQAQRGIAPDPSNPEQVIPPTHRLLDANGKAKYPLLGDTLLPDEWANLLNESGTKGDIKEGERATPWPQRLNQGALNLAFRTLPIFHAKNEVTHGLISANVLKDPVGWTQSLDKANDMLRGLDAGDVDPTLSKIIDAGGAMTAFKEGSSRWKARYNQATGTESGTELTPSEKYDNPISKKWAWGPDAKIRVGDYLFKAKQLFPDKTPESLSPDQWELAVNEVDRHNPTYRPSVFDPMGGLGTSKALKNVSVFNTYSSQKIKGLYNLMNDAMGVNEDGSTIDPSLRSSRSKAALGAVATLGILKALQTGVANPAVQAITGNDNLEVGPGGPFGIFEKLNQLRQGDYARGSAGMAGEALHPGATWNLGDLAMGKGSLVYHQREPQTPAEAALGVGKAVNFNAGNLNKAAEGKMGKVELMLRLLGIVKNKPPEVQSDENQQEPSMPQFPLH